MSTRSLNVPGSLSSALQQRYFGFGESFGTNCHFMPGREAGAAAPAQPGRLHHVDDLPGCHPERLAQAFVPAVPDVGIDRVAVRLPHV